MTVQILRSFERPLRIVQRLVMGSGRARYAQFLPEAQAVIEREPAPMARLVVFLVTLLFGAAIVWAAVSEVEQVASAPAVVRPAGKVKIVNHPEGGRVIAVHVRDGARVTEGDLLVELDTAMAREEVAKRYTEWQSLSAELARLTAEAQGKRPNYAPDLIRSRPDLVRTQDALFESRRQAAQARRSGADQVIEQRKTERESHMARIKQLGRSLTILGEQESAIARLAGKGYFPRLRHLTMQREINELRGQIAEAKSSAAAAGSALAEARDRRRQIDEEWRTDVLDRLNSVSRAVAEARSLTAQETGRMKYLSVRAPATGIVQDLAISGPGESVAPNAELLRIVPQAGRLIVEAQVANTDIGYVRPGQKATVKVRTFDFIRYGTLTGTVETIAADAVEDRRTGALSFPVIVRIDDARLGASGEGPAIAPGMQVDIDLHIGDRTILSYLTDRISRTSETAFRER